MARYCAAACCRPSGNTNNDQNCARRCVQIFLVQPIVTRLGEKGALVLSQAVAVVQFLALSVVASKLGVYGAQFVGALTGLAVPIITSVKANAVEEHEQGAVQGALSGAQALASGFGPLVFMQIWRLCTQTLSPPHPRVRSLRPHACAVPRCCEANDVCAQTTDSSACRGCKRFVMHDAVLLAAGARTGRRIRSARSGRSDAL